MSRGAGLAALTALAVTGGQAWAAPVAVHGDLKSFVVGVYTTPWIVAPELSPEVEALLPAGFDVDALLAAAGYGDGATVQGVFDARLKLQAKLSPPAGASRSVWRAEAHATFTAQPATAGSALGGASAGVGLGAPELAPLTWTPDVGDAATVRFRVDRLWVAASPPHLEVTVGRQPVSFGTGLVFTPMDVVNPFSVATIDTEYKPGVDAARVDVFAGTAVRASTVAAWAGPPITQADRAPVSLADAIFAENAQLTVGVTDLQALVGLVRGEGVFGAGVVSALGPVGVHGEATLTVPGPDAVEDAPFVRAVAGGEFRPTSTTTLAVEAYVQTFGASPGGVVGGPHPGGYLDAAANPRVARGEVWLLGRTYASLSVSQELTPLVSGALAVIANVEDPSVLLTPSVAWSVADEASLSIGGFAPIGARPDEVPLGFDLSTASIVPPDPAALAGSVRSEFGLYPIALFATMRAYF